MMSGTQRSPPSAVQADLHGLEDAEAVIDPKEVALDDEDDQQKMTSRQRWYQCCVTWASQVISVDDLLKMFPHGSVDVEDLKNYGVAVPITIFYILVFTVAFAFLMATSMNTSLSAQTLSLDGSNAAQTCVAMPVILSGSWDADSLGHWNTQKGFTANLSVYTIQFSGSSITTEDYHDSMGRIKKTLKTMGERAKSRDLAWNTLAFSAFNAIDKINNIQFFSTGSLDIVLGDLDLLEVSIHNSAKVGCTQKMPDSRWTFSYDLQSSAVTLVFNMDQNYHPLYKNYLQTYEMTLSDTGQSCTDACAKRSLNQGYTLQCNAYNWEGPSSYNAYSFYEYFRTSVVDLNGASVVDANGDSTDVACKESTVASLSESQNTNNVDNVASLENGAACSYGDMTSVCSDYGLTCTTITSSDACDYKSYYDDFHYIQYRDTFYIYNSDGPDYPYPLYFAPVSFAPSIGKIQGVGDNICLVNECADGSCSYYKYSPFSCDSKQSSMRRFCPCYAYDACPAQMSTANDFSFLAEKNSSAFDSEAHFNTPPVQPSQYEKTFQLSFDLRSALTAAAVNIGVLSTDALEQVSIDGDNRPYMSTYMDPYYSNMQPISCLNVGEYNVPPGGSAGSLRSSLAGAHTLAVEGAPGICFLNVQNVLFYPIVYSYSDNTVPSGSNCKCSNSNSIDDFQCNRIKWRIELLFFRKSPGIAVLKSMVLFAKTMNLYLINDPINGDLEIIEAFAKLAQDPAEYKTLCGNFGDCSSVRVEITKLDISKFLSVNKHKVQLSQISDSSTLIQEFYNYRTYTQGVTTGRAHCANTLYLEKVIDLLTLNPPVALVQPYLKCRMTFSSAMIQSLGNSAGTASLIASTILTAVLVLIVIVINHRSETGPQIRSLTQKLAQKERSDRENFMALAHAVSTLIQSHHQGADINDLDGIYDFSHTMKIYDTDLTERRIRVAERRQRELDKVRKRLERHRATISKDEEIVKRHDSRRSTQIGMNTPVLMESLAARPSMEPVKITIPSSDDGNSDAVSMDSSNVDSFGSDSDSDSDSETTSAKVTTPPSPRRAKREVVVEDDGREGDIHDLWKLVARPFCNSSS